MCLVSLPFAVKANKWKWQTEKSKYDPLVAWKKMKSEGKIDEIYDVREREGGGEIHTQQH